MSSINQFGRIIIIILNFTYISNFVIAQTQSMVTDSSTAFLQGYPAGATIASTAPTIDFGIVDVGDAEEPFSHWCNVVLGPDGRYYFAVGGDHNDPQGVVMLIAYAPATKTQNICIDSRNIGIADGKWHGRPVINPNNGDMYLLGFYNGDLVYYNIYSKQTSVLGQPVTGQGFQEYIWDWQRDRLYGIEGGGKILVYDTQNHAVIFFGFPVDSVTNKEYHWSGRSRLLDQETGILYGSEGFEATGNKKILSYHPSGNSFHAMQSSLEDNLRAWSDVKEKDGSFWIFDYSGNVYKFFPGEDKLEPHGENWDFGAYVTFIERSPGGRYLYYSMAHPVEGRPVIQYDTQTDKKKVIAFIFDYYFEKYDFVLSRLYGGALSKDGGSLFLVSNSISNNPGMFHIHIPESERAGDAITGISADQSGNPDNFLLEQNYPNPFNPSTKIVYHIPYKSKVRIFVYNIVGRKIAELINEDKLAGRHEVNFEAGDLSSGVYIYQLSYSGQVVSKKMLLLQ